MNARIGELQYLLPSAVPNSNLINERKSKDKIVNHKGSKLLEFFADLDLCVINGRVLGDLDGEITFLNRNGSSVIDYVAVSPSIFPFVDGLTVLKEGFSDHFPLCLSLRINSTINVNASEIELLPKLLWQKQNPISYRRKLEMYVDNMDTSYQNSQMAIDQLIEGIRCSSNQCAVKNVVFKQKWYDSQCYKARRHSFKWLSIYRKNASVYAQSRYLEANKAYKALCRTKKQSYYESVAHNLDRVKDAKDWWTIVRELQGKKVIKGTNISICEFKNHFQNLLNPPTNVDPILYAAPYIADPLLDGDIAMNELMTVISRAKDNKAPGLDRVPYEFFKNASENFLSALLSTFNNIFNSSDVPKSFTKSIIFPLFKKGDPNTVGNYRGLSFSDAVSRLFTGILLNRLVEWERGRNILSESQVGFRKNYSTIDNIFSLSNIISIQLARRKKKLYAFFIDFKAAFDSIRRSSLFYKLHNLGLTTKIIKIIECLYKGTKAQVWDGRVLSEPFETTCGVKQGCLLSPFLFSLFINDIEEGMESGLNIGDASVKALLYADDIVLLADEPQKLQRMIDHVDAYCKEWNLTINLDKSKAMIFQKGGGRIGAREKWFLNGTEIETVNKYTYLGIVFTSRMSFKEHHNVRLSNVKSSINSIWGSFVKNNQISHSSKFKMFNAVSRSVMCYGAQVWGFKHYEEVEKLLRFFIKKIFVLPQTTPNYVLVLETGLPSMLSQTLTSHFKYLAKVLCKYDDNRLPKKLAREIIRRRIFWYEEWLFLAEKHNVSLELSANYEATVGNLQVIVSNLIAWQYKNCVERAEQTVRHGLYNKLKYDLEGSTYVKDEYSASKISTILKCRSGMIPLNSGPWGSEDSRLCQLCNLDEDEDIVHFLGRCPILSEFRVPAFGKKVLTESEIIELLNGSNFQSLYLYVLNAWKYRGVIINEYY